MAIRMEKPWIELTPEAVKALPGQLGVYQLADADGRVVYIGFAGGRSLFGLRSELERALQRPARRRRALPLRDQPAIHHAPSRAADAARRRSRQPAGRQCRPTRRCGSGRLSPL